MKKKPIPPLTCPHIDRVVDLVSSIIDTNEDITISRDILERYVDIINAELEFIRQSNDELRIASVYWYKKANKGPTK
jgi:hypothetical protein